MPLARASHRCAQSTSTTENDRPPWYRAHVDRRRRRPRPPDPGSPRCGQSVGHRRKSLRRKRQCHSCQEPLFTVGPRFLGSSAGNQRRFQVQFHRRLLCPMAIAVGAPALNRLADRRHFGFRLRSVDGPKKGVRNEWHCRFCCMTLRRLSQRRWPIVDRQIHIVSRVARISPSARSLSHPRCEVLSGH